MASDDGRDLQVLKKIYVDLYDLDYRVKYMMKNRNKVRN